MKSARVAKSLDNERWDSAFHWPRGNHWFYNGFIRYLQATTICSTHNPSFSIGSYKVFLSTVFVRDVVPSHKWSRTVHPRWEACFLLVLQGFPCRAACVGAVLFGQPRWWGFFGPAVLAEILHFTNVLKVFGQPCWCGSFWPSRFGWNRSFYQRFEGFLGSGFFWPGPLSIPLEL